jgi:hypothetical protein
MVTRNRFARAALCGLVAAAPLALAPAAGAVVSEGPPVRLTYEGATVAKGQRSYVETRASFPGFTCEGYTGVAYTKTNPATTVSIVNNLNAENGGGEAFSGCRTSGGRSFSEETELAVPKLRKVTVTASTVTEVFMPTPLFDDEETGCIWRLVKLSGPLPSSGSLSEVPVSGALRLVRGSAKSCPKTAQSASALLTVGRTDSEGAPEGAYGVEVL